MTRAKHYDTSVWLSSQKGTARHQHGGRLSTPANCDSPGAPGDAYEVCNTAAERGNPPGRNSRRLAELLCNAIRNEGNGKAASILPKRQIDAAGKRQIPLVECLVPVLEAHRKQQDLEKQFAGSAWTEMNLVFSTGTGTYLEPRNIARELKKILDKAELPQISIHALRHTCATRMLENEVPIKVVQDILGHTDPAMSMRYSHVVGTTAHDQMNKLNKIYEATLESNEKPQFRRNMRMSAANKKKKKTQRTR